MNQAIRIIVNLEMGVGLESTQTTWYLELQAAGAVDATKVTNFNINIGGAGDWNATFELLAIGSNELIVSNLISFTAYESENEMPENIEEDLGLVGSVIEMLGPVAPHVTPMGLAGVAGVFILLQSGRIWSSGRSKRKVKEEFIKNRINQRKRPPLPQNFRNKGPTTNQEISPINNRSNTMKRLTNNENLLDDLI